MLKKKIVIIDVDTSIVETIKQALERVGVTVLCASDGLSGLAVIRSEKPDLVVLDIVMPKLDGLKVTRLIKYDERYAHIPVIVMTNLSSESSKVESLDVGASDFFPKSLGASAIIDSVLHHLGRA